MDTPMISVVVPCHNSRSTVGQTLESVRGQAGVDFEVVVVDDGSSDGSEEVIGQYVDADSRFRMIRQANRGLASARNRGLESAVGDFVLFLDSDDWLLPTMLARSADVLAADSDRIASHCGWYYGDAPMTDRSWRCVGADQGDTFLRLAHQNFTACHAVLTRTDRVRQVGGFDESLAHCQDWDLWQRLARTGGKFQPIPEPMAIYRMQPGSLSRSVDTFFLAGQTVIQRGHEVDPRVKDSAQKYKQGCGCQGKDSRIGHWRMYCLGMAIGLKQPMQARKLAEGISVDGIGDDWLIARDAMWFAAGVPRGQWTLQWPIFQAHWRAFFDSIGFDQVEHVLDWLAPGPSKTPASRGRLRRLVGKLWS